jgi:uncharacterized protein (DUF1501 family)
MITRRRFLQGMTVGGAALAAGCNGGDAVNPGQPVPTPPIPVPARPILVVVFIDGGNDWLQMMPPILGANRSAYASRRPTLAVDPLATTGLGMDLGLNQDFTGMAQLNQDGRVAWLPGIGMNNPNLSHFVSTDLWGQGSAVPDGTGWLGRFADTAFDARGDVLRGLTVTSDMPVMLRGARRSFVSITGPSGFVYPSWLRANRITSRYDPALLEAGFGAAASSAPVDAPSGPGYAAAAEAARSFYEAQNGFGVDGALPSRTPSVRYPGDSGYPVVRPNGGALPSGLSSQLKLVAQMIAAGLPTQVFFTRIGGWDTHSNEAADHPVLQRTLGGSIKAFYDDLASIDTADGNAQERVMVLAWSEFGRRVAENDGGTDHGTAGLAFCVGRAVRGGFYGDYPNLADLDRNGNMKFTLDFRSLYATVLDRWLGQATFATDALLGTSYPRLGFL